VSSPRASHPEKDPQNEDEGGNCDQLPGGEGRSAEIFLLCRAHVLGAGKLQLREFDLRGGLGFYSDIGKWTLGALATAVSTAVAWFCVPSGVRIDLCLAQAGEVVGDGIVGIQTEMLGIGADESLVEDAAGQSIEVFFFNRLQHARADLGDVGNVVQRELFLLSRFAEFISELSHWRRNPSGVCWQHHRTTGGGLPWDKRSGGG